MLIWCQIAIKLQFDLISRKEIKNEAASQTQSKLHQGHGDLSRNISFVQRQVFY